jgi:O-antigen/teichoic acid export membrane protein
MSKFEKTQIIRNVGSSWFSLGVNILVGIFLSPFILHRLGDTAYGIWVLIFSITGYYGLFDLGIRSSVVRYVSKFTATGETDNLIRLINTSLWSYTLIGAVAMLLTLGGAPFVDSMFRIPPELRATARLLFLMVGASVSLGFPLGIFSGILEGLQKFYFLNVTNVISSLLRAALIVWALHRGYGLITIAVITVILPLLISLVRAAIVLRVLPLRFGWKYFDRVSLREMATYSSATFVVMISYKLRFKTDELVIGAFLSSAAITYFSIGDRLLDYASEVVSSLAQIFVPMSSQSDAKGDLNALRKMFMLGNRACALIIFPISLILLILGKSVIEAWVGAKYVTTSYPVMVVLCIPLTLMLAQGASPRILFGMAKHRTLSWVVAIEALANVILSIILVQRFGIIGDALGTSIPLTVTALYFFPRHLCRVLGVRIITFVQEAYLLPLALCAPLVALLFGLRHWFIAHNYLQLAGQLLVVSAVYGGTLFWAHRSGRLWKTKEVFPKSPGGGSLSSSLNPAGYVEP